MSTPMPPSLHSTMPPRGLALPSASQPIEGRLSRALRIIAISYAVLLTYLLLAPEPLFFLGSTGAQLDATVTRSVADWVEHASVYLAFTGLVLVAWQGQSPNALLVMLIIVHAILTETLQHWIPLRETSLLDLLANVCGILTGALLIRLIQCLRPAPVVSTMAAELPSR